MIFYTTLIATFNLCLGYWLGVKLGTLPWQGSNDDSLVTLLSKGLKSKSDKPADKKAKKKKKTKEQPPEEDSEEESDEPETEGSEVDETEETPAAKKTPSAEVMNNLAAFQAQLANAGKELRETLDDPETFDQQASKLQESQHEYVDKAKEDVAKLGDDASETIKEGAANVEQISGQIDALMAGEERSQEDREKILNQTEALSTAVHDLSDSFEAHDPAAPKTAEQTASDIIRQIDELSNLVTEALSEYGEGHRPLLASLRLDDLESVPEGLEPADVDQRLLNQLASVVKADASDVELFGKERELVVLFNGLSVDDTANQLDAWRQQVEASQFDLDGQSFKATITCLLSEGEDDLDAWLTRLEEAHAESSRYGNNRTYHHDGAFAAPVAPADTEVKPSTITL